MPSLPPRAGRAAARMLAALLLALTAILAVKPPPLQSFFPRYFLRYSLSYPDFADLPYQSVYLAQHERLFVLVSEESPEGGSAVLAFNVRQGQYVGAWRGPQLSRLALSADGRRLYASLSGVPTILQLNPLSLAVERQIALTCPPDLEECAAHYIAAGPGNRLYWHLHLGNALFVSDGDTGELLATVPLEAGDPIGGMAVRGDTLFLAEWLDHNEDPRFRRYDVSRPVPAPQFDAPLAVYVGEFSVAPDGSFLLAGVNRFDAESLELVHTYEPRTIWGIEATAIAADSASVILLEWDYSNYRSHLDAYDVPSNTIIRASTFPQGSFSYKYQLHSLSADRAVVVNDYQVLVFDAHDQIVGLPVALSGFCGSPQRDDFSDPASGWPIGDNGATVYRYDRDQYSILQRVEGRYSAVTRGDFSSHGRKIEARTWLPSGQGISGLVFGLNEDWTQFFTFEAIPHLRAWAVFRYDHGWDLWGIQQGDYVNPVGQSNTLSIQAVSPERTEFKVNGTVVFTLLGIPDGRVGLSGGSLEPVEDVPYTPVDIRFDDYLFAGSGCPVDGRAQPAQSRLLPRPPLGTLLDDE